MTRKEIKSLILIIQKNFNGSLYNLVVISKQGDYYYADFIQIGADKNKAQIDKIINELESNYIIYKKNICKPFGIKLDYISLLFIFDFKLSKKVSFRLGQNSMKIIKLIIIYYNLKIVHYMKIIKLEIY